MLSTKPPKSPVRATVWAANQHGEKEDREPVFQLGHVRLEPRPLHSMAAAPVMTTAADGVAAILTEFPARGSPQRGPATPHTRRSPGFVLQGRSAE